MAVLFFYIIIFIISFIIFRHLIREQRFKNQKHINKETTILITGGCSGIGRELINLFISLFNCKVINIDILSSEFPSSKNLYKDNIININQNISKINNIISFLEEKGINPNT